MRRTIRARARCGRGPSARSMPARSCSTVSTKPSSRSRSQFSAPPSGSPGAEASPTNGRRDVTDWYREDLAYIHDVGHADFALESAPGILEILDQGGIMDGLVVDLGCGTSGTTAKGFRVGEDWAVLSEREGGGERGTMERRFLSFREVGE